MFYFAFLAVLQRSTRPHTGGRTTRTNVAHRQTLDRCIVVALRGERWLWFQLSQVRVSSLAPPCVALQHGWGLRFRNTHPRTNYVQNWRSSMR